MVAVEEAASEGAAGGSLQQSGATWVLVGIISWLLCGWRPRMLEKGVDRRQKGAPSGQLRRR